LRMSFVSIRFLLGLGVGELMGMVFIKEGITPTRVIRI